MSRYPVGCGSRTLADRRVEVCTMGPGLPGLSDDELEIIFERLCRPLDPSPAVALSAASRSMRAPVEAALGRLRRRHEQAKALLAKAELYIEGSSALEARAVPRPSLPQGCTSMV